MAKPLTLSRLIESDELASHLGDPGLRIVQVCSAERFNEGHPPQAIHATPQALCLGIPPLVGMTPSLAQIKQLIEAINLTETSWVVALDDEGGGWAGRLLWTLDMIGFNRWSLLNGGLWAWSGSGHGLTQPRTNELQGAIPNPATPNPATTEPEKTELWPCLWADNPPAVDANTLKAHLDDPDWVVWDARSAAEYTGERQTALRNGHIPGARHYEWTRAMDKAQDLRLRDLEQIRTELAALGITSDKTIVTHCQSHHRSGFTWALGRVLGFDKILAFPGSWGEWGNSPDLPIVTGNNPRAD